MSEISIVSGLILLNDVDSLKKAIDRLDRDQQSPHVIAEMFHISPAERPYFWRHPVASFAATYKNLDGGTCWSEFILKFEYILREVKFKFARLRLETELCGDFEFFWGAKTGIERELYGLPDSQLMECDHWFFGYGFRHMFGGLLHENRFEKPFNFTYPIEFDEDVRLGFNEMVPALNQIDINTRKYFENFRNDKVFGHDGCWLILTYLKLNKVINYGIDQNRGLFIERLSPISLVYTPYNGSV